MTNEVDRVFDFIPIETLSCLRLCSWPFSILQGSRILMNVDDSRFSALGVTAPDEAISHPIPPVRVEGQGPDLRLLVDVGAHSKIGQQLQKGLVSFLPLGINHFVDVVGQGHRDADAGQIEERMLGPVASLGIAGQRIDGLLQNGDRRRISCVGLPQGNIILVNLHPELFELAG